MTDKIKMQAALESICAAKLCSINSMSSRVEMLRLMDLAIDKLREALAAPVEPSGNSGEFAAPAGEQVGLTDAALSALRDAATSLETISALAGRKTYGEPPIETFMDSFADVRAYAASRASVARTAIAAHEAKRGGAA